MPGAARAQRALRESEERYRKLVESLPVAVAVHVEGKLVFANPEALRLLRIPSLEQAIGRAIFDFVHPDYRAMAMQRVADSYERKIDPPLVPERFVRMDGEAFDVEVFSRPVTFEGQPAGQVVFWDITERTRAEQALLASETRWRALAEHAPVTIMTLDAEGRILSLNRAFPGRTVVELVGTTIYEYASVPIAEKARAALFKVFERRERVEYEASYVRPDGTVVWLLSTVAPVEQDGGIVAAIHVSIDISERKRMEERLQQAEKMTALGQLAGGVAHDFNNQLAGILGNAELLREGLTGSDALRHHAESIVTGAQRSARLTRQLLAFARKGKYQTVTVDLHGLIDEVLAILAHSLDKRIEIRRSLAAAPIRVIGDPAQLQNALLNLAINARDAMPDGGKLALETEVATIEPALPQAGDLELTPGQYGCVRITDTGLGMDEETRRRAFEPFFTTKEPGHGTGLGLPAAYGIVRNHMGTLRLRSVLGHGTTVEVLLPLAASEADVAGVKPPRAETPPLRILLVDDEELVRSSVADMLRTLGHEVTECCDGREAVEVFAAGAELYDLVILDIIMPVMSGPDALTRLRSLNPRVRAILCSGYSVDGEAQRLMSAGRLSLLQKPFTLSDLADAISGAEAAPAPGGEPGRT